MLFNHVIQNTNLNVHVRRAPIHAITPDYTLYPVDICVIGTAWNATWERYADYEREMVHSA